MVSTLVKFYWYSTTLFLITPLSSDIVKDKKEKKDKVPRAPSAYNLFMKTELAKVKKEHPSLDHKEAFTKAANNWKSSSQNPKNKKK